MVTSVVLASLFALPAGELLAAEGRGYRLASVPLSDVRIKDDFWRQRVETNRTVSIPHVFRMCEETGIIDNFAKAAGLIEGDFQGIWFSDAQVYKTIEGASFSLSLHADSELDRYLDRLIAKIAAAQESSGYLHTKYVINLTRKDRPAGPERLSRPGSDLELYVFGHLYEAAAAHYQATGKRTLLDVAIKNADMVDRIYGPGKRRDVPGHEEIEVGLVKLHQVTGDERYLKLAKFFIDQRGRARGRKLRGAFSQDHKPVIEQSEAVGQAPRATYLYSAAVDIAALTGDADYVKAMDRLWDNVVSKKMYVTGGIGSRHENEGFGENYELPNKTAYAETCAAISFSMWNHRLFLLHGDAKYLDVLERTLYNNFLAGVSLSGDRFFYANPLECDGQFKFNKGFRGVGSLERKSWFRCPCCPPNVVRFVPSVAKYVYATRNDELYVNLFIGSTSTIHLKNNAVTITQETRYPWDGRVKITLQPKQSKRFAVNVRIPGWARGTPAPSDLYRYLNASDEQPSLKANGRSITMNMEKGFARIEREWKKGDVVQLELPMPVRRVVCHEKVKENAGRVALERGPTVYCVEGADNGGRVRNLALPNDAPLRAEYRKDLLGGVTVIRGKALGLFAGEDGKPGVRKERDFVAIPYCTWCNRGAGEMAMWFPRDADCDLRPTTGPSDDSSFLCDTSGFRRHTEQKTGPLCQGKSYVPISRSRYPVVAGRVDPRVRACR